MRRSKKLALTCLLICLPASAAAATSLDPVGPLDNPTPFGQSSMSLTSKDRAGNPVCFFRETGESHHLDIGIASDGAFARLEAPDDDTSAPPSGTLHIYAGVQRVENDKATDSFEVLKAFDGPVRFQRLTNGPLGFIALSPDNASSFLEVVAAARENFLVAQDPTSGRTVDYVAVYEFSPAIAANVLDCAKALQIGSGYPGLAKTLPTHPW